MKRILSILACSVLIIGIMSSNAFANSIDDISDEKIKQSEVFESNDNYNLNIDIQMNKYCSIEDGDLTKEVHR